MNQSSAPSLHCHYLLVTIAILSHLHTFSVNSTDNITIFSVMPNIDQSIHPSHNLPSSRRPLPTNMHEDQPQNSYIARPCVCGRGLHFEICCGVTAGPKNVCGDSCSLTISKTNASPQSPPRPRSSICRKRRQASQQGHPRPLRVDRKTSRSATLTSTRQCLLQRMRLPRG